LEEKRSGALEFRNRESEKGQFEGEPQFAKNNHPTVKPISLNEKILKLFKTPNSQRILYPFA
jgi:DNA modification methylase